MDLFHVCQTSCDTVCLHVMIQDCLSGVLFLSDGGIMAYGSVASLSELTACILLINCYTIVLSDLHLLNICLI